MNPSVSISAQLALNFYRSKTVGRGIIFAKSFSFHTDCRFARNALHIISEKKRLLFMDTVLKDVFAQCNSDIQAVLYTFLKIIRQFRLSLKFMPLYVIYMSDCSIMFIF